MQENILIVHDIVHEYRLPIFEKLSSIYNLTIAYSDSSCNFKLLSTIKLNKIKIYKLLIQPGLLKIINKYDLVILPLDFHYPQYFIYSFLIRKKLIWFGHGLGKSNFAYYLRLCFVFISKATLLYYNKARDKMIKNGIREDKIFVINNTVYVSKPSISSCSRNYFIYFGRIQERKQLLDICIAVNQIKHIFIEHGISFKIIGDGDKTELIDYICQNKIEDVIKLFPATFNEPEIQNIFSKALAYVSPGHVGLGVLHSFAYGVPVITSRNAYHAPEFENLEEYKNCILFDGSIKELVECFKLFINNQSVSYYLGRNAYQKYIRERSADQMVTDIIKAVEYAAGR